MKELINTNTYKNLIKAYMGETQAKSLYQKFLKVAEKEKNLNAVDLFTEAIVNEDQHAKAFLRKLNENNIFEEIEMDINIKLNKPSITKENLLTAAKGENFEFEILYPEFAKIAYEEGFDDIGKLFEKISIIEERHEKMFNNLYKLMNEDKEFKGTNETIWVCRKCGNIHIGNTPPEICDVCNHSYKYFRKEI